MTIAKYPGWKIEKDGRGYTMLHAEAPKYAVSVIPTRDGGWIAEILTRSYDKHTASYGYDPARNSFSGAVTSVCAEVLRRAEYWRSKESH